MYEVLTVLVLIKHNIRHHICFVYHLNTCHLVHVLCVNL